MTKDEILNNLRSLKDELAQKFGVVSIGLFGSFVKEGANEDSDIDIAIEMAPDNKNIHNFLAVKRRLETVFGRRVDLGIESTLKPIVKKHVEKEIIYA